MRMEGEGLKGRSKLGGEKSVGFVQHDRDRASTSPVSDSGDDEGLPGKGGEDGEEEEEEDDDGDDDEETQSSRGVLEVGSHPSQQDPEDSQAVWPVKQIIGENKTSYLVEWDCDDPSTGRPWEPSYTLKEDVSHDLVENWRSRRAEERRKKAMKEKEKKETATRAFGMRSDVGGKGGRVDEQEDEDEGEVSVASTSKSGEREDEEVVDEEEGGSDDSEQVRPPSRKLKPKTKFKPESNSKSNSKPAHRSRTEAPQEEGNENEDTTGPNGRERGRRESTFVGVVLPAPGAHSDRLRQRKRSRSRSVSGSASVNPDPGPSRPPGQGQGPGHGHPEQRIKRRRRSCWSSEEDDDVKGEGETIAVVRSKKRRKESTEEDHVSGGEGAGGDGDGDGRDGSMEEDFAPGDGAGFGFETEESGGGVIVGDAEHPHGLDAEEIRRAVQNVFSCYSQDQDAENSHSHSGNSGNTILVPDSQLEEPEPPPPPTPPPPIAPHVPAFTSRPPLPSPVAVAVAAAVPTRPLHRLSPPPESVFRPYLRQQVQAQTRGAGGEPPSSLSTNIVDDSTLGRDYDIPPSSPIEEFNSPVKVASVGRDAAGDGMEVAAAGGVIEVDGDENPGDQVVFDVSSTQTQHPSRSQSQSLPIEVEVSSSVHTTTTTTTTATTTTDADDRLGADLEAAVTDSQDGPAIGERPESMPASQIEVDTEEPAQRPALPEVSKASEAPTTEVTGEPAIRRESVDGENLNGHQPTVTSESAKSHAAPSDIQQQEEGTELDMGQLTEQILSSPHLSDVTKTRLCAFIIDPRQARARLEGELDTEAAVFNLGKVRPWPKQTGSTTGDDGGAGGEEVGMSVFLYVFPRRMKYECVQLPHRVEGENCEESSQVAEAKGTLQATTLTDSSTEASSVNTNEENLKLRQQIKDLEDVRGQVFELKEIVAKLEKDNKRLQRRKKEATDEADYFRAQYQESVAKSVNNDVMSGILAEKVEEMETRVELGLKQRDLVASSREKILQDEIKLLTAKVEFYREQNNRTDDEIRRKAALADVRLTSRNDYGDDSEEDSDEDYYEDSSDVSSSEGEGPRRGVLERKRVSNVQCEWLEADGLMCGRLFGDRHTLFEHCKVQHVLR